MDTALEEGEKLPFSGLFYFTCAVAAGAFG